MAAMCAVLAITVAVLYQVWRNSGGAARNDPNWLDDKYGEVLELSLALPDRGVIVQGRKGEIVRANEAACTMLGLTHEQLGQPGKHATWTIDAAGPPWPAESSAVSTTFYSGAPQTNVTTGIRRGDGQIRWLSMTTVPLRAKDGVVGFVMATFDDITATMDVSEQTVWRTLHDDLTGLDNKAHLVDRMEHALTRRRRHGGEVALLMCGVDDFKAINDSHGRAYGDHVLVEVANRMRATARDSDTVARYREDEFAIFVDDGGVEGSIVLAKRIQAALADPIQVPDSEGVTVSVAVGIATGGSSVDVMVAAATSAMLRAKTEGRGEVIVFESHDPDDSPRPEGTSARGTGRARARHSGSAAASRPTAAS